MEKRNVKNKKIEKIYNTNNEEIKKEATQKRDTWKQKSIKCKKRKKN